MKSLEKQYIERLKFPLETLSNLRALGEYKGKEDLFVNQSPDMLEKLLENAIIASAECSNRIEGVIVEHKRVERLVKGNATPSNRSEQEVTGYKDILNLIHQSHEDIPLNENVILQFHSMLYRYTTVKAGSWKKTNNVIVDKMPDGTTIERFKTVPVHATPDAVNKLNNLYNNYSFEGRFDQLVLIPLFILDFLCIHPFNDGNGRIARLLTLMLLYHAGYKVGKFISLERIIEKSKEDYYDALAKSSVNWHKGKHEVLPWLNYFYGILIAAYKEFELRVGRFHGKGSKSDQVKKTIEGLVVPFSISDIEQVCPNVQPRYD